MIKRIYCIVRKGEYIYIPIKASVNPYDEKKEVYLAKMPNFFGGNIRKNETKEKALCREVQEESQKNITSDTIMKSNLALLLSNKISEDTYDFYLADVIDSEDAIFKDDKFDNGIFRLDDSPNLEANCKEMSCILKVPVTSIKNKNADTFFDLCKEIGQEYVMERKGTDTVSGEWDDSETKKAFEQWDESETKKAFEELCSMINQPQTMSHSGEC